MLQIFCFGCYGRVRAATERNAVYTDHDDTVLPNVHWRVAPSCFYDPFSLLIVLILSGHFEIIEWTSVREYLGTVVIRATTLYLPSAP